MKRLIIILFVALAFSASAQISGFGVRLSGGLSTITDDLTEKTPIFGASLGGYLSYGFERQHNVLSQLFYLNIGLNVARRGGIYSEKFDIAENLLTERVGKYDALYVQVPVLAQFRFELPMMRRQRHYASLLVGPAVSVGVIGQYSDRAVTPFMPQREVNYVIDHAAAFDYMNRLDVSAVVGLEYEINNFTLGLFMDYGFCSVKDEVDAVKTIENGGETTMHPGGNIMSFLLSVGYKFVK